jgi:hypothetical protein
MFQRIERKQKETVFFIQRWTLPSAVNDNRLKIILSIGLARKHFTEKGSPAIGRIHLQASKSPSLQKMLQNRRRG